MKKFFPISMFAAAVAVIPGCVTEETKPQQMKMALGVPDGKIDYKPVSAKDLNLKLVSKTELHAGAKTALVFSLVNTGRTEVSIPEWFGFEPDNLVIFVQPWLSGMKEPDPNGWTELSFDLKVPVMHYPLTLLPGNQVMIAKELPFVEKLHVSPGKERRYFIKAETNLKSLKLKTDVSIIKIRPKQPVKLK